MDIFMWGILILVITIILSFILNTKLQGLDENKKIRPYRYGFWIGLFISLTALSSAFLSIGDAEINQYYSIFIGILGVITGYLIIKRYKLGWLMLLGFFVIGFIQMLAEPTGVYETRSGGFIFGLIVNVIYYYNRRNEFIPLIKKKVEI